MSYDLLKKYPTASITPDAYQKLYQPALEPDSFWEELGACLLNTKKTFEYLVKEGVPESKLRLLYVIAYHPGGRNALTPNLESLRAEEQQVNEKSGRKEWGYHAALISVDTHQVFDLSAKKELWGKALKEYLKEVFVHDQGKFDSEVKCIVTPTSMMEPMIKYRYSATYGPTVSDLIEEGRATGGGIAYLRDILNKPETEWFE